MANEKAIGNLVIHMGLDDKQMRPTLKNIEQSIKAVDSAWKATYQSQKRVGDDLGAAKTKYDGLNEKLEKQKLLLSQQKDILATTGKRTKENAFDYDKMTTAIGKSQAKVERFTAQLKAQQRTYDLFKTGIPDLNKKLKQQQETTEASSRALEDQGKHTKALMSTQKGYKDQMSTLNDLIGRQVKLFHSMSKSDDLDAYHNQAVRIQNLKHQLSGLQDSYESVGKEISKEQYQQRNSGHTIDDLNKKLNQQKETTNAYVETLAKQGKSYDALVVKQRGLKEQTQIMTELVQKEQEKFSKMNKSLDGDDYHKQEMHVIQLKDKLRDLTGEFSRVSENVHKLDVNPFKRFSKGATEAKEKTEEAGFSTHKMMFANLASNAISSAWIAITGHIKEAIGAGKEYWIQQQKMQAVWTTLTGSAEKGKAMVNTINDFSVKTGQAVDVVDELQQGFYHLHSSKKEADMLTHAMLNMGDTVGLTGKQLNAVGQDMTHALAQGHLTTGALNQLAMYFPMVEEKLAQYEAKIHHKSHESASAMVSDLRAETKAGTVSAAAVEKLFDQLGNHRYAKAAENIMHTMFGMQRAIESRTPALIKDIEDPFMKVKSPIYAAVAKWVSDKRTDKEFQKLGNSFALGATTISNAFAKAWHVNDFSKSADKGIDALSNSIERGSKKIAKNAPEITRFLKDLGGGSAKGLRIFAAATVDVSKVALPFLDIMAKYPKQSGLLVASLWAATKAQKAWHEAIQITDMAKTIAGWAAEKLSIKSNTGAIVLQNKELRENVKLKEEAAATSAGGVGGESGVGAGNTGKVAKEAEEAEKVSGEAEKAGRFSKITSRFSNFKNVSKFGKVAAGGVGLFDVLNSATDLMGMTKKTTGSHVGAATGSLGGTAAGAAIGTAIFPGIGTAIGAGLGGMAGEGIGRKLGKAIQKGLTYKKIKTPKVSMDSAYNKLLSQGKAYYSKKEKQDLADVKLLYKNGDLTKAQYEKRVSQIKKSGAKANTLTKASEKGRNVIIKAYTQARQKLSESYNRKILNAQIKYGTRSKQVQELENKKKRALAKQQYDYEHNITVKQAKLQTTLNGKLKLSADKQKKIYEDLVHSKKKLSENELKTTVSNAKKQEKETVKYANDTKSKAVKAAYKKYAQTVNAAKNEYKGHSKWSDEQRKKVIDHATDERDKSIAAAEKKRKDTINKAHDQYKKTVSYAHSQNKGVTSETSSEYTSTKKINSQIKGNYDLTWGDIWSKVGKWANKMISGLNKGPIKGQNSVFSQYGGTNTLSAINTSYFASGTGLFSNQRRPISKPTLAILNDGHDSPETGNKEALIHPNGMAELVQGTNTPRLLGAGTEVLNATETKLASELGLVHFAGGTGVFSNIFGAVGKFFKKAVGSLKQKLSAITGFMNHSDKTFDSTFNPDLGKAKGAVFNGYKHLANHKIKNQGQKWWGAAWNVINGVANSGGGDATGLLAAVEKYGKGNKYVWGAAGPDSFDCSGLVMYALKHAFGINYPHFSGAQYAKSEHINKSSAKPGDLVFWGPSSHVGVYAGGSKYYSAFSPSAHPNIGMYNMYTHGGDGKMLFGRVAGLSDKSGSKKHGKQPKGLMGFAEKQLKKSGVLAWVKKFLEPLTDAIGGAGNPSGDGVGRWRSLVIKALKANGFSASESQVKAWLQVIRRESGGNPNARQPGKDPDHDGSGPALGLVQTKRGTFNAYKKSGHGNIFNGFDDLLAGINYAKHRYGRGASMFSRVAAEGYSNGGLTTMSKLIHISEQNKPEMILPLTDRNRSVQLINQAKNMMNLPKTDNLTNIALIKLVNNLSKTVDKLSEKLDNINNSIINKPIISDNMVGKMYDNYSARKTFKKRAIRGDNPL